MRVLAESNDILFYCKAGAHRSAMIVALVICILSGRTVDNCVALLMHLRPIVQLNLAKPGTQGCDPLSWMHEHRRPIEQLGQRIGGISNEFSRIVADAAFIGHARSIMTSLAPSLSAEKRARFERRNSPQPPIMPSGARRLSLSSIQPAAEQEDSTLGETPQGPRVQLGGSSGSSGSNFLAVLAATSGPGSVEERSAEVDRLLAGGDGGVTPSVLDQGGGVGGGGVVVGGGGSAEASGGDGVAGGSGGAMAGVGHGEVAGGGGHGGGVAVGSGGGEVGDGGGDAPPSVLDQGGEARRRPGERSVSLSSSVSSSDMQLSPVPRLKPPVDRQSAEEAAAGGNEAASAAAGAGAAVPVLDQAGGETAAGGAEAAGEAAAGEAQPVPSSSSHDSSNSKSSSSHEPPGSAPPNPWALTPAPDALLAALIEGRAEDADNLVRLMDDLTLQFRDRDGKAAIHHAATRLYLNVVLSLLERNPNLADLWTSAMGKPAHWSALHCVCDLPHSRNTEQAIVSKLLSTNMSLQRSALLMCAVPVLDQAASMMSDYDSGSGS